MSVALRDSLSAEIAKVEHMLADIKVRIHGLEQDQFKILIEMEMKKAKFTSTMAKLEQHDQEWINLYQDRSRRELIQDRSRSQVNTELIYIWENMVDDLELCEGQMSKHRSRMLIMIENRKHIDALHDQYKKSIEILQNYRDIAYENVMRLDAAGVARLCGIDSVPNDALFLILRALTPRSLLRLMQTGREFCHKCRLFISTYRPDHPIYEYLLYDSKLDMYMSRISPGRYQDGPLSDMVYHNYQTLPMLATQMHVNLKFNAVTDLWPRRSEAVAQILRDLYTNPRPSLCTGLIYKDIDQFINMVLHDMQFIYTQPCTMHITLDIYNKLYKDLDRHIPNRKIFDKLSRAEQLRKINADRIIPFGQSNLHWRFTQQVRLNQTAFAMWVRRDIHITAPSIFIECPTKHRIQAGGFRFLQLHREFHTTIKPEYFAHWLRRPTREFSATETGTDRGKTVFYIIWNGPLPRRIKK